MIISCPKCGTQYDIAESLIPEQGRKFRCAKCGHVWVVTKPIAAPVPIIETAPIVETTPSAQQKEEVETSISVEDSSTLEVEKAETETETTEAETTEIEPSNVDNGTEATSTESLQENDENKDTEEQDLDTQSASDPENEPDNSASGEETTEEAQEEPSTASSEYNEGEELPEQLRNIKTSSLYEMEEFASNKSKSKSGLIAFLFFFVSLLIAFYVGRFYIVATFPPSQSIYEAVGVSFDVIGEGLSFQEINKEKLIVDDLNYLIVEGILINESNTPRKVPNMVLYLYNNEGKLIQSASQKPPVSILAPGETAEFTINLEAPSVTAIEAKISFIESKGRRR